MKQKYELTYETVKMVYDWFHKAYPNSINDENCTEEEMLLSSDLEQFLIDND